MVVQVGLDRQASTVQRILVILGDAAETLVQLRGGAVGRVRDLAGERQPGGGAGARVVVAAAPRRIQLDRTDLRVRPRRLVGGRLRARGHDHQSAHALRVADRPLDRTLATQRRAHDNAPLANAEQVSQAGLRIDLVARGNHGETRAPRCTVRSEGRRARGPLTATQHVRGHHEVAVRVDDAPRAHDLLPPAGGRLAGRGLAAHVRVAGQRVQDEDRVRRGLVQGAPRLVGERHGGQDLAVFQALGAQVRELAERDRVALAPRARRGCGRQVVAAHEVLLSL